MCGILSVLAAFALLAWRTYRDLLPLPDSLNLTDSAVRKVQILDRHGIALTVTYQNHWNIHDYVALHQIPLFLQQAFLVSEDQRFFQHGGVDWIARLHAVFQNLAAMHAVRGASTISEQVVRLWHPRPRTVWSRWLEGLEAARLERRSSKADIFEFYLNEVPYAAQRRGVVQAARCYFGRDLDTLSRKEMLALAVMVRAPARLDVVRDKRVLEEPAARLARQMQDEKLISEDELRGILASNLTIQTGELPVQAGHFVHYLYQTVKADSLAGRARLRTTLDGALQSKIQQILDQRIADLNLREVSDGAVLVVDHHNSEVLAWVTAGEPMSDAPQSWIDPVTTPRQPGSALKPFLYALALESGWTAATILDDSPLREPVGVGLHTYHNYSRGYYGPVRLREALGNSLNIPAVRTIQHVGAERFLQCLTDLGIHSLVQHPDYYGDGLALGNGEITLLELVRAYAVLARQGIYRPLSLLLTEDMAPPPGRRVFSAEVASLIGDILSDPQARTLEFGQGSLLRFPVQTAVKTGTSSDYRDAWAAGYNDRYTVGVWMGNLDRLAMQGITGSTGPALVLRAVFAELNRHRETRSLYLSPRLVMMDVCRETGQPADGNCPSASEWFVPGTQPRPGSRPDTQPAVIYLQQPSPGLQLAMDPRIPDDKEAFLFKLAGTEGKIRVEWLVDGQLCATTAAAEFLWPLQRGRHIAKARIWRDSLTEPTETTAVAFVVQ
jgi:penicillin-binding protein 1C